MTIILLNSIGLKNRFGIFAVILLSLLTGILAIYGYGILAIGLCLSLLFCVIVKSLESIFLFWLLFFSLLSTQPILTIGARPILTFDRVIIVILLFFLLVQAFLNKRRLLPMYMFDWALIIFLISIVYSNTKTQSQFYEVGKTFDLFFIPVAIYFLSKNLINNNIDFKRFLNVMLIIGIYVSLIGLYEHFTSKDVFSTKYGLAIRSGFLRINGPYEQDIAFGVNVVICFFVTFYKYITCKVKDKGILILQKVFYILVLLMLLLAVFFNYYRGIWISLLAGLMIWFIFINKGFKKKLFIVILFTNLIIFSYYLRPHFDNIMHSELAQSRVLHVASIQDRLLKFNIAINEFRKNPATGIGLYNLTRIKRVDTGAHNTFLSFLAETGLLGFSILIFLILLIFQKSLKNIKLSKDIDKEFSVIFLCVLVAYFLPWLSNNIGYYSEINKFFYCVLGVAFSKFDRKF